MRGRRRQMLQDWIMVNGYSKMKEKVQHQEDWCHRTFEPNGKELEEETLCTGNHSSDA